MEEMRRRGYEVDTKWFNPKYRGKSCQPWTDKEFFDRKLVGPLIYTEHNKDYLRECLDNLKGKDINIKWGHKDE